jgi:enamine deaminase RidA (YjgF/YER057c/UK114 family)
MTIQRLHPGKRLSAAVVHNGLVYLSGQVPEDTTQEIAGQAEQVLATIDRLLREAGTDKSKLLWAQIFLPDMKDFPAMNAVWEKWVAPGQTPARATLEAKLANPAYKIEIMCTAAL